ncbi:Type IV secretion-system coupling protein DNA-binding domain-containing protein [Halomicrobium zhouii]|uniref:Type IV secretion-system coupling protein DNA-binding domain-containing protein n=1 Tax=Halomicrobium zhouii TaxID=767519 RepID=A0A1I6M2T0_9EURY|nr:type IV secretion system DNA-binding domain-containing protein [Halomicrobium zhouii]SFS09974.1 Type IV secretion-system coupling protein DNA-binding domain-containing protein [Halomicrobium zhouii]
MSSERDQESESVYYDEEVLVLEVLWRWLRLAIIACIPPLLVDRDAPPLQRFVRWRFVYGSFLVLTVTLFGPTLLAGHLEYLLFAPVFHVAVGGLLLSTVVTGSAPGVSYPILSDGSVLLLHVLALGLVAGAEWTRRRHPAWLGLSSPELHRNDDEFVVPMAEVDNASEQAPAVPRMDQSVSTAFIGETGSGKTSAMQLFAEQYPNDDDVAVFVHDYGDDFQQFYGDRLAHGDSGDNAEQSDESDEATEQATEHVTAPDETGEVMRVAARNSDVVWNLFRDVEREQDLREVAGAVFGEPDGNDPFHNPALQVFEAVLVFLYREAAARDRLDRLGHDDVVRFVNQEMGELHGALTSYDDLVGAASHIDPDSGRGAPTVYSTLHEHVRDVFVGDFAAHGEFSIREYLDDPAGVLVVDSSTGDLETCGPMFRLLLDWAIKRAMASSTPANFILDEVDRLPQLQQLPELAARGRAEGARALVGVQTVGQLKHRYGGASSGVLGNCPQGVYFAPGDSETTEYILDEIGDHRHDVASKSVSRSKRNQHSEFNSPRYSRSRTVRETDRAPIPSGDLKQFTAGECIVKSPGHWWIGRIEQLEAVRQRL